MKTIGHHTCRKTGGDEIVLREAPFFAEHKPKEGRYQFLGSGYYFWENNLDLAKTWGRNRYRNSYFIVEIDIEIKEDTCYDLVGNRLHQIHSIEFLREVGKEKKWSLQQLIAYLKEISKENPDVFPFKIIRAIDYLNHTNDKQMNVKFVNEKSNYTILNPKIVIFAFDKASLNLESSRIAFASKI